MEKIDPNQSTPFDDIGISIAVGNIIAVYVDESNPLQNGRTATITKGKRSADFSVSG